ncbi:MAG: thioredoxin [Bacteroidaceae bacterium]|nr:thioredoxin [Bacteroidaceae bacterium]
MEKFSEIINGSTPVLVDFFAEWCGPCKAMKPVLDEAKQRLGDKVRIIKIDVDKNNILSQKLEIRSVPTLILYLNGKIVWRASGARPLNELIEIIERYSK